MIEIVWILNGKRVNIDAHQVRNQRDINGVQHPHGLTLDHLRELGYQEVAVDVQPADYAENAEMYMRTEQDDPPYIEYRRKSDEQIAEVMLAKAKAARQAEVDAITVTVGEKVFDGDERSQDRMSRAINAMDDTDQTLWVLADNTPTMVTKAELRSALRLAGEAQTAIWIKPYQ